jgi:hypothetical protein
MNQTPNGKICRLASPAPGVSRFNVSTLLPIHRSIPRLSGHIRLYPGKSGHRKICPERRCQAEVRPSPGRTCAPWRPSAFAVCSTFCFPLPPEFQVSGIKFQHYSWRRVFEARRGYLTQSRILRRPPQPSRFTLQVQRFNPSRRTTP